MLDRANGCGHSWRYSWDDEGYHVIGLVSFSFWAERITQL